MFARVGLRLLAFSHLCLLAFVNVCLRLLVFARICLRPPLSRPPLRDTETCHSDTPSVLITLWVLLDSVPGLEMSLAPEQSLQTCSILRCDGWSTPDSLASGDNAGDFLQLLETSANSEKILTLICRP